MFITALFIIAKRWKQLKYSLIDEWISKMLYIPKMEYYLVLKRKEILQCGNNTDVPQGNYVK
jgi:hypothetical protein